MIWKPHLTVAAIIKQDNRFLMVEELVQGERYLNQPAGHLEENESLTAAVIRETLEETAWHFQPEFIVGIYRWRNPRQPSATYIRVAFAGAVADHEPDRTLDQEILRTLWLPQEEIRNPRNSLRSPLVIRALDDYLAGAQYPLALLTDLDD